jgi:hypothetical protein
MERSEWHGQKIVQAAPEAFIDVDIEADGIAGFGSILSIGAISPFGAEFYRELKPIGCRWLDDNKEFSEQHGLSHERLLIEGEEPLVAIREFAEWTRGVVATEQKTAAVFCAFNASFDFPFIDLYMKEAGVENPYGVAGFCTKSLAMALVSEHQTYWDWKRTKKSGLPAQFVPDGDFTHNALEDARYQQKIHFRMASFLCDNSVL